MNNRIVARYLDGRLMKGISLDIHPSRPTFHLRASDGKTIQVKMAELKAAFFVRTLEGNAEHKEHLEHDPKDVRSRGASVLKLKFKDGEVMVCLANALPENRPFFFVTPVDASSNNLRILVNQAALAAVELPGAAEAISRAG